MTVQEKNAVKAIPVPAARFWQVHVDLVGPLPEAATGEAYLLTVFDWCNRWPEAVLLRGISAQECADTFFGWLGGQTWRPSHGHYGQGDAVHRCFVGESLQNFKY